MAIVDMPSTRVLLWSTLRAVFQLGGSASIPEIVETVTKDEGLTDEQQSVLHNDGPKTEIEYRLSWARTRLKGMGLLTNSARGVWALTDEANAILADREATGDQQRQRIDARFSAFVGERRKSRRTRPPQLNGDAESGEQDELTWQEQLLKHLMAMQPDAFERLAKRLLREADFDSVTVTGKSGDGGIDGFGVYRFGLVSFPVFFQCKRYRGSVGSGAVRDFRGAMSGRGDKGLLITTGSFTADAKREANRDGAQAIDLIDGDRLCDLLKQYELGVRIEIRQVEEVSIEASFFSDV